MRAVQQLLTLCSMYDVEHDAKYSGRKSVFMRRSKEDKCLKFLDLKLSEEHHEVSGEVKYLEHVITEKMRDGNH